MILMLIMMPRRVWLTCIVIAIIGFLICHDDAMGEKHCDPASCGDLDDIGYPFRVKTNGTSDPKCLSHPAELSCEQNQTVLNLFNGKYHVKTIDYSRFIIRVVDPGLLSNACPFRPLYHLTRRNFSTRYTEGAVNQYEPYGYSAVFFDCSSQVNSAEYIRINCSSTSSSSSATYSYIMLGDGVDDLHSCNMTGITMLGEPESTVPSFSVIHDEFRKGLVLSWTGFLPSEYCYTRTQSLNCFRQYVISSLGEIAKATGWSLMARMILGLTVFLVIWSY